MTGGGRVEDKTSWEEEEEEGEEEEESSKSRPMAAHAL